jgi:hypothetical protein
VPGIFDLLNVRLDYGLRLPQLHLREANVNRQVYRRRQPEFRLPVRVCDMDMYPGLLAREKEQSELAVADDCGCDIYGMYRRGASLWPNQS